MMNQCRACKYFRPGIAAEDKPYDCAYFGNRAEVDFYEDCRFFKRIENPDEYIESFTACDDCIHQAQCSLIDVTNIYDELDHVFDLPGNVCIAESEDYCDEDSD